MRLVRILLFLFCLGFCFTAPICSAPLRVVTLGTVLTEIAQAVGGGELEVTGILKPGVDPHTFEPNVADIKAIQASDLIFVSGLGVETYLQRLARNVGDNSRIVSVGELLESPLYVGNEKDPHWWQSIDHVIDATNVVRDQLASKRPAAAAIFERNADTYTGRLRQLQVWVNGKVEEIPISRRHLITTHDAFGYFARDYHFRVHSLGGLTSGSEPSAREVARLIDLIKKENVRTLFVENGMNGKITENIMRETGAHLGGKLFADGLGAEGASTYEGMYRHNVEAIVAGLK